MVAVIIISIFLHYAVSSYVIPEGEPYYYSEGLVKCVTNIVTKYFALRKELIYVGNKPEDIEVLKAIHFLNDVTIMSRRSSKKLPVLHNSYFVSTKSCSVFTEYFPLLSRDTTWNPNAYFFIVVKTLDSYGDVKCIFDISLKQHVTNIVVINATAEAHLYGYNPFDNYGCGKHYSAIISYGKCSEMDQHNLFPEKYITGLKNCTFNVAVPNWPPFTLFPPSVTNNSSILSYGVETYLLRLVGEMNDFTLNIKYENSTESFSTVSDDMNVEGPMKMLQNDEADVILGGLLLTPSRAYAFDYVYDFLPYVDEIRFLLKRADFVAPWKTFYLEFDGLVWILILLSLTFYSIIMIILLHVKDKGLVVIKLLDNLLLHSCRISCHSAVKGIFIIWIWAAYLLNTFYQSSLVSLTTNPPMDYQISTEEDILQNKLQPCFSEIMEKYYLESAHSNDTIVKDSDCQGPGAKVLQKVISSKGYYSLSLYIWFDYNIQQFSDDYGEPQLYLLKIPYTKVIYCMYFYKGFPFLDDMRVSALRIREMGLVEKAMSDMNYLQTIKHRFHGNKPNIRFVVPWHIYIFGCTVALITFIIEILSTRI